jgi:hypothetical protein
MNNYNAARANEFYNRLTNFINRHNVDFRTGQLRPGQVTSLNILIRGALLPPRDINLPEDEMNDIIFDLARRLDDAFAPNLERYYPLAFQRRRQYISYLIEHGHIENDNIEPEDDPDQGDDDDVPNDFEGLYDQLVPYPEPETVDDDDEIDDDYDDVQVVPTDIRQYRRQ